MSSPSSREILFLPVLVGLHGGLFADNLSQPPIQAGSSGFAQAVPGVSSPATAGGLDIAAEFLPGCSINCSTSSFYDSNLNQSGGSVAFPVADDFVQSLSSSIQWAKNSSLWNLSFGMAGSYNLPINTPELKSLNYGFNGAAGYQAARLKLGLTLNQSFNEGSNRFYGGVIRQNSVRLGITADYELGPKTSLVSSYNSTWTNGENDVSSTYRLAANVSAMWKYSALLQFGPGLGYSEDSGASLDARTTLGPTLSANYLLSRKVSIRGVLGWQFVNDGNGTDATTDALLSSSISASYALNQLWGFGLSLNRGVQADGLANAGFREITALDLSVNHRVGRATAVLAFGYDHSDYPQSRTGSSQSSIDFLTGSATLSMPVFGDSLSASLFFRYNDSMSGDAARNWDGFQTGCSLSYNF